MHSAQGDHRKQLGFLIGQRVMVASSINQGARR